MLLKGNMKPELTWIRHVHLSIAKGYVKLKQAFRFKNFLNESSIFNLTEAYILSQFNYGDVYNEYNEHIFKSSILCGRIVIM